MNKEELWDYYQELLKSQGFEGITDLLAKYHNLVEDNKELAELLVKLLSNSNE